MTQTWQSGKGDPQGIESEIRIFPFYLHKLEFVQKNEALIILCDFEIQTDCPISVGGPALFTNNKKKRLGVFWFSPFRWITIEK